MTDIEYQTDLEYLYHALQKHPLLIEDKYQKECFEQLYLRKKCEKYDYNSFLDAATELTVFFHDGHTNIEIPYTLKSRCLRLQCCWNEKNADELLLERWYDDIPEGSKIAEIEGMAIENVINMISCRIPHENVFLVKSRMIKYPYINYHIFSEMNLKLLFGEKDEYLVSFFSNGKIIKKKIPLSFYDGFLDFPSDEDFLSYEILDNTVIMHLNSCICNEKYKEMLKKLAYICKEKQIDLFILDLSSNMGGSSAVIDEFISFTDIEYFRRYEMIDFSSGKAEYITRRQDLIRNQKKDVLLPKHIYCKVSHHTFSSARTFAVTLKDNQIAEIIGIETGGKPNSYGMPLKMRLPESDIRFRVSRCCFLRPDADMDAAITLTPNVIL